VLKRAPGRPDTDTWRLPASEIETLVVDAVHALLIVAPPSIGRSRKAFTLSSISPQRRLTWLFEMPLMPSALTRSSTDRV
jgi:hypothetical protein